MPSQLARTGAPVVIDALPSSCSLWGLPRDVALAPTTTMAARFRGSGGHGCVQMEAQRRTRAAQTRHAQTEAARRSRTAETVRDAALSCFTSGERTHRTLPPGADRYSPRCSRYCESPRGGAGHEPRCDSGAATLNARRRGRPRRRRDRRTQCRRPRNATAKPGQSRDDNLRHAPPSP